MKYKYLLIIITFFLFNLANAASFNCDQELSKVESLICANEELSLLDEKLEIIYSNALNQVVNKTQLVNQQEAWFKLRNTLINENRIRETFIPRLYKERLFQLKQYKQDKDNFFILHEKKFAKYRRGLNLRKTGDTFVFDESGYPKLYKISEFNPQNFTFSTLFESKIEYKYVAHNDDYIVLSNMNYGGKVPLIVFDRKSGKEIARKDLKNQFVWGEIENNLLIGVQKTEGILFDLKTLQIKKLKRIFHKYGYVASEVVKKDKQIIIQTPYTIDIFDLSFNRIKRIQLPQRTLQDGGYNPPRKAAVKYPPGKMVVYNNWAIINVNAKSINIYDLDSGELLKTFGIPSRSVSYSINNNKLWVFPREKNKGIASIFDLTTSKLITNFTMHSEYQIWNDTDVIILEVNRKPFRYTTFTKASLKSSLNN
jgi:hypothetical protein